VTSTEAVASAGPDRVPEVDAVLARLGLGRLLGAGDISTFPGRNQNWAGRTDRGHRVFVKRFGGPPAQATQRLRRSVAFGELPDGLVASLAPRCLGWDEPARVLVTEFLSEGLSGANLAADGEFGPDLAFLAGRLIGSLHQAPAGRLRAVPAAGGKPVLPSADFLRALPWPAFRESSAGELKAWRLMQGDEALGAAVTSLLAGEELADSVPAHCDLRLDQFLLSGDHLYVTDWEEFRLADAARDVGSFAGEWLHRAATGWAGSNEFAAHPPAHDQIVRCCAAGIEEARPAIAAFWSGYHVTRPGHDGGLAGRATAFAGWHLFDRMLAAARQSVRLSPVHRAAAGIGRKLLLAPSEFAATIGLDQPP
jgi:hypothetical protein